MAGYEFEKKVVGELNAFGITDSVDGYRKNCVGDINRMYVSKQPKFVTKYGTARKISSKSLEKKY